MASENDFNAAAICPSCQVNNPVVAPERRGLGEGVVVPSSIMFECFGCKQTVTVEISKLLRLDLTEPAPPR